MNIKSNFMYIFVAILFIGVGFLSGYFVGDYLYGEEQVQPTPIAAQADANIVEDIPTPVIEPESTPLPSQFEPLYYLVKSDMNKLEMYVVENGETNLLKSFTINSDMFPIDDRNLLSKGIKVNSKEEALSIVENFTS